MPLHAVESNQAWVFCHITSFPPSCAAIDSTVTALFFNGGIKSQAFLYQNGQDVQVSLNVGLATSWQIHKLPVDVSVDPKLRCGPEHVGRALPYRVSRQRIYGATTSSLILHSLVVFDGEQPIICGTIVPFALPTSAASTEFKSDVFGRMYVVQWPGECV